MTSELKRYELRDILCQGEPWRDMRRDDEDGEWVRHEDALVLERERDEARAQLGVAIMQNMKLLNQRDGARAEVARLRNQRLKLIDALGVYQKRCGVERVAQVDAAQAEGGDER